MFHAFIKKELDSGRTLRTPFKRERIFFGLRPGESGSNNKIFNEAYSYIPQSTVGDNTGFTVFAIETGNLGGYIIQESHDSIVQEINDTPDTIWTFLQATREASKRVIRFHNGIEVEIPWEAELGYDFYHTEGLKSSLTKTKKIEDISYSDIQVAWYKLQEYKEQQRVVDNATTEATVKLD